MLVYVPYGGARSDPHARQRPRSSEGVLASEATAGIEPAMKVLQKGGSVFGPEREKPKKFNDSRPLTDHSHLRRLLCFQGRVSRGKETGARTADLPVASGQGDRQLFGTLALASVPVPVRRSASKDSKGPEHRPLLMPAGRRLSSAAPPISASIPPVSRYVMRQLATRLDTLPSSPNLT
jgi:hypothetical protein